jgi:hypothetical protein
MGFQNLQVFAQNVYVLANSFNKKSPIYRKIDQNSVFLITNCLTANRNMLIMLTICIFPNISGIAFCWHAMWQLMHLYAASQC